LIALRVDKIHIGRREGKTRSVRDESKGSWLKERGGGGGEEEKRLKRERTVFPLLEGTFELAEGSILVCESDSLHGLDLFPGVFQRELGLDERVDVLGLKIHVRKDWRDQYFGDRGREKRERE
jgi:hypothetical protein